MSFTPMERPAAGGDAFAGAVTRALAEPYRALARRLGPEAARRALVRASIEAACGRRTAVSASLVRLFADLPAGETDLRGAIIAAIAESTLPASLREDHGVVYTDPGMAGFAIDAGVRALGTLPRRVLDPACGTGVFLVEAARRFSGQDIALHGMDRDEAALDAARARLHLLGRDAGRVSLRRKDALSAACGPRFDLVVGNPPYVRQERLGGERVKRALAARLNRALRGAGEALHPKADLSVAFLLLGLARLRVGGVLSYVTSNAWLDALYGAPLRKFLAERAEVRLVAEWEGKAFARAAANPVVVVVRRKSGEGRRPAVFARYTHQIHGDGPRPCRGKASGARGAWMAHRQQAGSRRLASEPRWGAGLLRRADLLDEVYRSAPGAFARLDEIAALHYGTKPGLVDFFVLGAGTSGVEDRFLVPVLSSTAEITSLKLRSRDLTRRLFVCPLSRPELRAGRFPGARAHVMRGERARTRKKARHTRAGTPYPEVPSVRANAPWYHLRPRPAGDFAIPLLVRERHMIPYAPERMTATNMFYQGRFADRALALPGTAVLNSSVSLLALESLGRINIGGRMNVYGPEIRPLRVPDPGRMQPHAREAVAQAFERVCRRPVGTVSAEVCRPDRRALDAAVLAAAGVPSRFAPLLAEALEERVARRLRREVPGNAPVAGRGALL